MPLIDFLSSLPLWLLAPGLNAFLVGIALGGVWLVRRKALQSMRLGYDTACFAAAAVPRKGVEWMDRLQKQRHQRLDSVRAALPGARSPETWGSAPIPASSSSIST